MTLDEAQKAVERHFLGTRLPKTIAEQAKSVILYGRRCYNCRWFKTSNDVLYRAHNMCRLYDLKVENSTSFCSNWGRLDKLP